MPNRGDCRYLLSKKKIEKLLVSHLASAAAIPTLSWCYFEDGRLRRVARSFSRPEPPTKDGYAPVSIFCQGDDALLTFRREIKSGRD